MTAASAFVICLQHKPRALDFFYKRVLWSLMHAISIPGKTQV